MADIEPNNHEASDAHEGIDLIQAFHLVRERLWLLVICLVFTCLLGGLYLLRTPKTYEAEAIIQVEQAERKIVDIQDVTTEDLKAVEQLKTIEQNLSSKTVLQRVIEELGLTPEQLGFVADDRVNPLSSEIRALKEATKVKLQRGTRLITVTVANTNPELAQQLSNEIVKQFIRAYQEQRVGSSADATSFLLEEQARLEARVIDSEAAVQKYKDSRPGIPLDDSQNLMDSRMLALNASLNDARSNRFKLESDFAQIRQLGYDKPDNLLSIPSVAAAPAVLAMQSDLADAESEFAALTDRYKPKHPIYIQAQRKLGELRTALERATVKAAESVGIMLQAATESEAKVNELLKAEEKEKLDFTKVSLPYAALVKTLEGDREIYNNVQRRVRETELIKSIEQGSVHVIEPAFLPDKPAKPKPVLVIAASLVSGLVIGALLIFATQALDQSFKTVDEIEKDLGLAVVGSVPKAKKGKAKSGATLTIDEPDSPVAEAFRSLRASLSLLSHGAESRSVLFTSSIPGEGKTFCSVNYAVALSQLGGRTLIIDGDLRKPTVHTLFFETAPTVGVSSVISGGATLAASVLATKIPHLSVLAAGPRMQNPAELLAQGTFSRLVKEALASYDHVVVDSAPIHAVSDALLMLKDVGSVCFVIHAAKTNRRLVTRAIQRIVEVNGQISGIVVNQLPESGMGYYHYYAGRYGDEVYGAPRK